MEPIKYLAIIQARSGSTRLPGKVLKNICGKPQLEWVIERVSSSKLLDRVMVATTNSEEDKQIVDLCNRLGVECFTGSENDVLDRYYQASKPFAPEYVVRITADCPCFDARLLDQAIKELDSRSDYLGMMSETFPDGLDLEIIKHSALEEAWKSARMASQREHLTQYIVTNPNLFVLQDFRSTCGDHGSERWTVDEPADFELVSIIFEHFLAEKKLDFGYEDILSFLNANPSLKMINSSFARNEGLAKSLREDYEVDPFSPGGAL